MRLLDAFPELALNAPGKPAGVVVELQASAAEDVVVRAELLDLGVVVSVGEASTHLPAGANSVTVQVSVPENDARGYQLRVKVTTVGTRLELMTYSALLAARHWRSVPRYGFLSEFTSTDPGTVSADVVRDLAKFHVTIVQFYDWMFRHYQFLPPVTAEGEQPSKFVDAMEREVAPGVVARRVQQCKQLGMAPIAYGAVYGPEPEFILERPDWLLYDSAGKPLNLIELFYITDLRPGGWREHIMQEFEAAVHSVGFEGIHMDQYGFPKLAYDAAGVLVNPSEDFPSMIDEAARRVKGVNPEAGVIFNAVNDWPIDTVAPSDQEAVYIEVWSPHDRYRDLVDLIRRARDLSGKQTILSAYLLPFHDGGAGAEWALRYITAVINAAGGHHLVLGEGTAVLREPYYPDHGHLSEDGVRLARRYYDHSAAFTHYLHAPDLMPVARNFTTGINTAFTLRGALTSAQPEVGSVWLNVAQRDGQREGQRTGQFVLNLVNLTGLDEDSWNVTKPGAPELTGLTLVCEPFLRPTRVSWASPDEAIVGPADQSIGSSGGSMAGVPIGPGALELTPSVDDAGVVTLALPPLRLWATIVVEFS